MRHPIHERGQLAASEGGYVCSRVRLKCERRMMWESNILKMATAKVVTGRPPESVSAH